MSLSNEIMRYLDKYDEYNIIDNIIEYKIDDKIYLFPYYVDNNIAGFIGLYDVDNINEYVFVIKFVCKYIQELFTLSWK